MSDERLAKWRRVIRIGADDEIAEDAWRKLAEGYEARSWPAAAPTYAFVGDADASEAGRPVDMGFLVYQLAHLDTAVRLAQAPSSIPVVGPLLDALKRPLHQLVLFYVNRVAAQSATATLLQTALIQQLWRELQEAKDELPKSPSP